MTIPLSPPRGGLPPCVITIPPLETSLSFATSLSTAPFTCLPSIVEPWPGFGRGGIGGLPWGSLAKVRVANTSVKIVNTIANKLVLKVNMVNSVLEKGFERCGVTSPLQPLVRAHWAKLRCHHVFRFSRFSPCKNRSRLLSSTGRRH